MTTTTAANTHTRPGRSRVYVDEVVSNAPYKVTTDFLDEHDISVVVHGDDIPPGTLEEVFGAIAVAGKLRLVPRTAGISTTDLIHRVYEQDPETRLR
jgi:glycerol-3-phosphate cytidylyltransferase-like family protein